MNGSEAVTIRHGPRQDLLSVVIIYPTAVAAVLGGLSAILPRFGPSLGIAGFLVVLGTAFFGAILVQLTTGAEEVVLTPEGITSRHRIFATTKLVASRTIRWEWLDPVPRGRIRLGFVRFRWHEPGGYLSSFQLNVAPDQARAILAHPACPRKPIPPETLRRLGLPVAPLDSGPSN